MSKDFSQLKKSMESMDRVTFGKHSGNTWFWVVENFPDYIIWCVGNTDLKFSYQLIVDAIKSKYAIKKRTKTEEVDGEYVPEKYHPMSDSFSRKKPAYFYDGGLRGEMAHFSATQEQEANDRATDRLAGPKGWGSHVDSDDWDDDVPF